MGVAKLNDETVLREEFLTFRLAQEEYAIDILLVREIRAQEQITPIADTAPFVVGIIDLRGVIVPIVDLRLKFGLADGADTSTVVIVLSLDSRLIGIVVDAVGNVVSLRPEQIRPKPSLNGEAGTRFIRGIAPVDGRMLIVADTGALLASPRVERAALAA